MTSEDIDAQGMVDTAGPAAAYSKLVAKDVAIILKPDHDAGRATPPSPSPRCRDIL